MLAQATWPAIEKVRINTQIEFKLEEALTNALQESGVNAFTSLLDLESVRLLHGSELKVTSAIPEGREMADTAKVRSVEVSKLDVDTEKLVPKL